MFGNISIIVNSWQNLVNLLKTITVFTPLELFSPRHIGILEMFSVYILSHWFLKINQKMCKYQRKTTKTWCIQVKQMKTIVGNSFVKSSLSKRTRRIMVIRCLYHSRLHWITHEAKDASISVYFIFFLFWAWYLWCSALKMTNSNKLVKNWFFLRYLPNFRIIDFWQWNIVHF